MKFPLLLLFLVSSLSANAATFHFTCSHSKTHKTLTVHDDSNNIVWDGKRSACHSEGRRSRAPSQVETTARSGYRKSLSKKTRK